MATPVQFRLYVAGNAPYSQKALVNLRAFCERHLRGRHEIEIVDLFADPGRALADKVLLTPTLSILAGAKTRRIIGDLSDTSVLTDLIDFEAPGPS
jgi:circadian clock protein KaiB